MGLAFAFGLVLIWIGVSTTRATTIPDVSTLGLIMTIVGVVICLVSGVWLFDLFWGLG